MTAPSRPAVTPEWRWVGAARVETIRRSARRFQYASIAVAVLLLVAIVVTYGTLPRDPFRFVIAPLTGTSTICLFVAALVMRAVRRRATGDRGLDVRLGGKFALGLGVYSTLSFMAGVLATALAAVLTPFTPWPTLIAAIGTVALGGLAVVCARWFRRDASAGSAPGR